MGEEISGVTEITWQRVGGKSHIVTIRRSYDEFPPTYNRMYKGDELAGAWPGTPLFWGNIFLQPADDPHHVAT